MPYTLVELKISPVGSTNKCVKVTVLETENEIQPMEMLLMPGAEAQYLYVGTKAKLEFAEIDDLHL